MYWPEDQCSLPPSDRDCVRCVQYVGLTETRSICGIQPPGEACRNSTQYKRRWVGLCQSHPSPHACAEAMQVCVKVRICEDAEDHPLAGDPPPCGWGRWVPLSSIWGCVRTLKVDGTVIHAATDEVRR